jgi:hypothetical protein
MSYLKPQCNQCTRGCSVELSAILDTHGKHLEAQRTEAESLISVTGKKSHRDIGPMQANRCLLLNLHTLAYINGFRVQSFFLTKYIYIYLVYLYLAYTHGELVVGRPPRMASWPHAHPHRDLGPHTPRPSRGPTYI